MKKNIMRTMRFVLGCFVVAGVAVASPSMAATPPYSAGTPNGETGQSMRPLWVLVAQRGPDNEDAMITAYFYTRAACEEALNFFREQQEHPRREFHGACLPSGAS
ncbi:hypothetical protein GOB86_08145 [Acetobacter lambici]|uniref:Uncharacterized protein n=1 Tax=Acetobacter lambici TaxID=1332824 RepID=A0ABT1F0J8_9PROT|nr:hypothetical protein [Acetobacter lambici]MCP1242526.1 hypothetical protein [Acetobacter lambici]MCP1258722.1 hypothetical protein [Acetobacter lambici]NHO57029.1 hypothetical protein [Acetobacter lambici]